MAIADETLSKIDNFQRSGLREQVSKTTSNAWEVLEEVSRRSRIGRRAALFFPTWGTLSFDVGEGLKRLGLVSMQPLSSELPLIGALFVVPLILYLAYRTKTAESA